VPTAPYVDDDGGLVLTSRCRIAATDIALQVTTSGGPGGQHANRSLTAVVATIDLRVAGSLRDRDRDLLIENLGPVVRSTATRFRSQGQNRQAALDQLCAKLAGGLHRDPPRRATKPSRASQTRRVDSKKARGRTKALRRGTED
jgi:ribosome-associated protein